MNNLDEIFNLNSEIEFERAALKVFEYQYANCEIYRSFCESIHVNNPKSIEEIPFLPISFFKTHVVTDDLHLNATMFLSSGTGGDRSKHYVIDTELYKKSFRITYSNFFGNPQDHIILALLPNYVEQGNSSLVYMVKTLIDDTDNELSGFILNDESKLIERLNQAKGTSKKVIIFGVTYTLLDLNPDKVDLSGIEIIETGGMKGRREEMTKDELHQILRTRFNPKSISSEYGMTELLSQAYAIDGKEFKCPAWMRILIRDTHDPFCFVQNNRTGGVNIIDLANYHSCSFIATQDLGKKLNDSFEIMGRFDHSELRGCNLLVQ